MVYKAGKNNLSEFIDRYENDLPLFRNTDTELDIWLHLWSCQRSDTLPKNISETLDTAASMKTTFPLSIEELLDNEDAEEDKKI